MPLNGYFFVIYHQEITTFLMGMGFLKFCKVQDNYQFGGEQYINLTLDHKDPNSATLVPRLIWLSVIS
jgi:hypothetical protein